MTESQAAEAVTVTDAQVDDFFKNEGSFSEPKAQEPTVDKPEPVKAEVVPETPEADKKEKVVNYGALHEERQKRKAEQERAKKAEERVAELQRQLQQYVQPKQETIDNDDPLEAMRRKQEMIEKIILAQANQTLEQTENQKYWNRVKESELAFKQDKPDFDDAVKFLADTRKEELKDLGFSDEEAAKVLADEIKWISDKAYADEVNPAERFYNLAKRRGWKAQNKEETKDISAEEKLNTIKKGQETNRALPPASKSVKNDLTAEALADMNVDALTNLRGKTDFDAAWEKLFGKQ